MFTWNFQYISKARLAETFDQLMLDNQKGDVLVRIHTAIHLKEEAVELARFIKSLVPNAHILGTSTSAVINRGKLAQNQCVISVTQMDKAKINSVMLPAFRENGDIIPFDELSNNLKEALGIENIRLLLTFLTAKYVDIYRFVDKCNECFPGTHMIGGLACSSGVNADKVESYGYIFNETGCSNEGLIAVSIQGSEVECCSSCITGMQPVGDEIEITDAYKNFILETDHKDAAGEYRMSVGNELKRNPRLSRLFPFSFDREKEVPSFVWYQNDLSIEDVFPREDPSNREFYETHPDLDTKSKRELIHVNYNVEIGSKVRRAFIYDKKIVSDNRKSFTHIENFEKAETIFAYSCIARSQIYSNCLKWELSAYENSNMSGCITAGEIVNIDGKNVFATVSFVISVFGEKAYTQRYNPYAFSHTDSLANDNQELINYLRSVENNEINGKEPADSSIRELIREYEIKLFYSETEGIPNEAALNMDIEVNGYDRICMINITDSRGMKRVFSEKMIDMTYKNYITRCAKFAKEKSYRMYLIDGWHIAIGTPSYMTSLRQFTDDMKMLQSFLFESSAEYIAIVPLFCLIDGCSIGNIDSAYYLARVEMMKKNIQFYVSFPDKNEADEESIREKYRMVNVITYAIAHDKVIPYFQGIYDNRSNSIHHYESLMRLEDENGTVYYPGQFLDVARSYGHLYDSLSKIMVKKVLEMFDQNEYQDLSVSINLGMRDIKNTELVDYIFDFLAKAQKPENFVFEILENEDIEDYDSLMTFVDRIHTLGALISIDDFGSGYSNLQHIMSIHSDYIKIDGSIIRECCDNNESENVIALITGWKNICARDIGIIAEYVENNNIQEKMMKFDIDFSQGYLFSKPSKKLDDRGNSK
ncbi:MAG: EAL domain-containing protein [Lachnospiraceae bacterium]|nr:EAL domain-containing protein [Lachnospiraceae bacterium]